MRARALDGHRLVGETDAALDRVREVDLARLAIDDADVDDLGVEDLLDLVAHNVVHRLHVKPLGQAALDLVDDRQLCGALVGLREETLGLAEQARVLERHAHARGDGRQQSFIRLVERVLAACSRG